MTTAVREPITTLQAEPPAESAEARTPRRGEARAEYLVLNTTPQHWFDQPWGAPLRAHIGGHSGWSRPRRSRIYERAPIGAAPCGRCGASARAVALQLPMG